MYAEPDLFSPSDQTVTLASSSKIPMTGETGGADSTPSTATIRKFVKDDMQSETNATTGFKESEVNEVEKRKKTKRGVNEVSIRHWGSCDQRRRRQCILIPVTLFDPAKSPF